MIRGTTKCDKLTINHRGVARDDILGASHSMNSIRMNSWYHVSETFLEFVFKALDEVTESAVHG